MAKLPTNETINLNLNEILALIINAKNFVSGMTLNEFVEDNKAISAVSRSLQLISHKASFISQLARKNRDVPKVNLPYRELSSMGRRLNHLYQKVPPEVIWNTIDRDLDGLEKQVRQSLGNRISDTLPKRIIKYPKIQLFKQGEDFDLTSSVLALEITPFVDALTELQHIIDYVQNEPPSIVQIQYIGQNSPVGLALDGVAEAIRLFIDVVVPWRRIHAEEMAKLERQQKLTQIEVEKAEVLEKRANAVKQREEARKITMEIQEKRIDITLKVLQALPHNFSESEKVALTNQLLQPIKVLTDSQVLVTLPENPRE